MATQGFLVDHGVMAKAQKDFDEASIQVKTLMSKLNSEVTSLIGSTQNFNGAARIAFNQNQQLLNERTQQAQVELNTIGAKFNDVMNRHTDFSQQQAQRITQTAHANSSGIISGLNG